MYSGNQITKAGKNLANMELMLKDKDRLHSAMDVLSYFRSIHVDTLNAAFIYLQDTTLEKDKSAIFARRLKRHISIVRKLIRFQGMKLNNMQDIGGARAILSNEKKLYQVARQLKKSPVFRNQHGKLRYKDYIKKPKDDGYRSYHLIGEFSDSGKGTRKIEIQLRTRIQHYWATALEIIDLFTNQALKSNQGDEAWKEFFIHVSEQFAVMDEIHLFDKLSNAEQIDQYKRSLEGDKQMKLSRSIVLKHCRKLQVLKKLDAFAKSLKIIDTKLIEAQQETGYVLLKIDLKKQEVSSKFFNSVDSKLAEDEYIEKEKLAIFDKGLSTVALVATSAVGDIREAYPNYFADSTKFLEHLNIITS